MKAQNLISVEEAAITIGVPPWCFYKWIRYEYMPCGLRQLTPAEGGSRAGVDVSSVRTWMKRHGKDGWIGFGKRKPNNGAT